MKNQKQTKKNNAAAKSAATKNAAKKPSSAKASTCAKAMVGKTEGKPADMSHRVLTMAEYLAMEKVASAIERACRVRRKYVLAMKGATEVIDRNLDKLREIVWSDGVK